MVEVGTLRAVMNLFLPLSQAVTALSLVILPYVARKHGQKGRAGSLDQTRNIMVLFASSGLAYGAIIIPFRHTVMRFLYNANYTDVAYLVPWLALASLFWICAHSTAIGLRAMQSPSSVCIVYGAASLVCFLVGLPASLAFGLRGVILSINLSSFAALATGIFLIRSKLRASLCHGCEEHVQVGAYEGDVA
jgi:O-antigen/teichoic acid export membrane protein